MQMNNQEFAKVVIEAFTNEEQGHFALLSQIPSSTVRRLLAAYLDLSTRDKAAFKQAVGCRILGCDTESSARLVAFADRAFQMPPPPIVKSGSPASATELKKLIGLMMSQKFQAKAEPTSETGERRFSIQIAGDVIVVVTRIISRPIRLEYHIQYHRLSSALRTPNASRISYEGLLGLGIGVWDEISTATADQDVALLGEAITKSAQIVRTAISGGAPELR